MIGNQTRHRTRPEIPWRRFFWELPFGNHIVIGTMIRLFFVLYGQLHDDLSLVPYTDVDYKVFTDASRYLLRGESPYKRLTYRYSPLLAILLTPNVVFDKNFGKILFSLFDICVAVAIKKLVKNSKMMNSKTKDYDLFSKVGYFSALFWIYNPYPIIISTRGNADSMSSFVIILSLLFHQTNILRGFKRYLVSGLFLGTAIHLRIYPVIFILPMYLSLANIKITKRSSLYSDLYQLFPNSNQIAFLFGTVFSLASLTHFFYYLYGYEFLYETFIYHFLRRDTKHNFSLFFYMQYLMLNYSHSTWYKSVPLVILLFYFGIKYGRMKTLNFAIFVQSAIFVVYNTVQTSQYFIWYLSVLPLCVSDINMTKQKAIFLTGIWGLSQAFWLLCAYWLEFDGKNVFIHIWFQSVVFFFVNLYCLVDIINCYRPGLMYYDDERRRNVARYN